LMRKFTFLEFDVCLVWRDSAGILDRKRTAIDRFRIRSIKFRIFDYLFLAARPRNSNSVCCEKLEDYERAPEDSLSAGIKRTLGKVYYFSTSGAGMLFVKFI
jgi:hypothetical protein